MPSLLYSIQQSERREPLPEINVGQAVDIVIEQGVIKHSSIQEIVDERIVLLQTVPPLAETCINKTIFITYIRKTDRQIRMGFRALITEICEGYVTVGRGFPAIIVKPLSVSAHCDLRAHNRALPHEELSVKLGNEKMNILDISEKSAHLVRPAGLKSTLKTGEIVALTFQNGPEEYVRQAKIIRQWHTKGTDGPEHLAVILITKKII